jgi:ribonuclease Z
MEVTLLGTTSMVPTADRNHSGILVSYRDEKILIDCGEGTQRQIRKAKISPMKIKKILITHWHGDHVLGLPGLMQTLARGDYSQNLEIYGPKNTKKFIEKMFAFFTPISTKIKYKVTEIKEEGIFFENDWFQLEAIKVDHNTETLAYSIIEKDKRKINKDFLEKKQIKSGPHIRKLQEGKDIVYKGIKIKAKDATFKEKGKKVAIVMDTKTCKEAVKIAKNADLFICEATLLEDLKEMAKEYHHLTAKQAAEIAKKAKVKKLVLTHISQRYKNDKGHQKEAKEVFKDVIVGRDLQKFKI